MTLVHVTDLLDAWFANVPQGNMLSALTANGIGMISLIFLYLFTRRLVLPSIQRGLTKVSPTRIGHLAPELNKLTGRLAAMLCCVAFLAFYERVLVAPTWLMGVFLSLGQIILVIIAGFLFSGFVNLAHAIYNQLRFAKDVPIQGIVQVTKLLTFIVSSILVISMLLDKSPTYILSGFGAIAAVTLLVFKDTILGLVASIQIAANRLVKTGDWIQVDAFGADGEVLDLGLNTVRVKNWDNTVTTIPTYMLISDSFKNWRAMQESAGRRIKRSLLVDMHSITCLSSNEVDALRKKFGMLEEEQSLPSNVTNLGLFRRYAELYLKTHPEINQECVCMVRELAPANYGLPIELYCFSRNKQWVAYEHIQADILDHMLATMGAFGLRPYQSISGQVLQQQTNSRESQ